MDIENGPKTTITASELLTIMQTSAIERRGLDERGAAIAARAALAKRRPDGVSSSWPFDSDDSARIYAAEWLMEMARALGGIYGSAKPYNSHFNRDYYRVALVLTVIALVLKFDVESEDGIKRFAATYVREAVDQAILAAKDAV